MPHNPSRIAQSGAPRKTRHVYPNAGIRISDIASRNSTYRLLNEDFEKSESMPWGFKVTHYKNDVFEVVYAHVCANNYSGMMIHEKGDRIITVLTGQIYLKIENEEPVIMIRDKTCVIKEGVAYSIATDGSLDAELLITQPANYDDVVVFLTDDSAFSNATKKEIQNPYLNIQKPSRNPITDKQALLIKEQRESMLRRRNSSSPPSRQMPNLPEGSMVPGSGLDTPAGQVVTGVSPMPIGARANSL